MSDAGFKIDVPKGRRAEIIRGVAASSKARILAKIDEKLAAELDPDVRTQLEEMRANFAAENVQRYVMRQMRAAILGEEAELKKVELEGTHKQQIRQEMRAHLQQFEEL